MENKTYIFERIKAKPDFIYVINDDFYAFGSQTCFIANKYYSFVKEAYENYQKAITSTDEKQIKECYKKESHEAKRIRAGIIKSTGKEFHTKFKREMGLDQILFHIKGADLICEVISKKISDII